MILFGYMGLILVLRFGLGQPKRPEVEKGLLLVSMRQPLCGPQGGAGGAVFAPRPLPGAN